MQPIKVLLAAGLLRCFLEAQLESDAKEVTSWLFGGWRTGARGMRRQLHAEVSRQEGEAKSSDSNHGFRSLGEGRPGKGLALLLCVQILSLIFRAAG